ncbi:hypothetical protein AVEN_209043-1 [Araneus ventricosus]|uniref:Uncharacterized protein n=1 Tax=Araneus ventricosus TaxID=182803 RepID=A0A4Y2KIW1_ARAVE|nr:hypothetical protein AVEN_209043-1 [Araneus ventricosus]
MSYSAKVRTFVENVFNPSLSLKCYSENLHLFQSGSEPKTDKLDFFSEKGDMITWYGLKQMNVKPLYPLDTPQVFVAIHSPYVPLYPVVDLHPEKEEHLLPPPYQTDCRDNGPSKDAKASTNPNSFQVTPSQVAVLTQNVVHALFQG